MRLDGGFSARAQHTLLRLSWIVRRTRLGRLLPSMLWMHELVFSKSNTISFQVGTAGVLKVPLWDGYWTRFASGMPYEPEVAAVLARVLTPGVAFLDGGANIGYWSCWAIGRSENIIAVEASPSTYARLEATAALNGNRFKRICVAIWSESDATIEFIAHDRAHVEASAVNQRHNRGQKGYATHSVPTIGLKDLYDRHIQAGPWVMKLDLEGAEAEAFSSARSLFEEVPLLCVYEDHPSDRSCPGTAAILRAGLPVWFLDPSGPVVPIESVEAALFHKTRHSLGYNFVTASRGSEFARILHGIAE
jgi:FkbM family methyltransferase